MTFNMQLFVVAAGHTLLIGRAWARKKLAERAAAARHHDPVNAPSRGPLLSMMVGAL